MPARSSYATLIIMKRGYKILISLAVLFIVARIALPLGFLYVINKKLSHDMPTYVGRISNFSISFHRGSYEIDGLRIWRKDRAEYDPIIAVDKIRVSFLTHLFIEKKVLVSVDVDRPRLHIIDSVIKGNQQYGEEQNWEKLFEKFIPYDVENIKVADGSIVFVNRDYKKPVQVSIDKISVSIMNLHNTEKVNRKLPGQIKMSARLQREGWIRASVQFNKDAENPTFNLKADLTSTNLARMNNTFILYGPYYFLRGEMSLFSQVFVNNGAVRGYLTPFFKDVEAVKITWNNRIEKHIFAESIQALGDIVLSNSKRLHGKRYAFSGQMVPGEPRWQAFWTAVRSGFQKNVPGKKNIASRKVSSFSAKWLESTDGQTPANPPKRYGLREELELFQNTPLLVPTSFDQNNFSPHVAR
ncbi:hypothetical protein DOE51_02435 [Bdellovibrio sp. NC01]|nr:hypothetical protein DOE51_02435 [Bdellovibrio sp. NC01]